MSESKSSKRKRLAWIFQDALGFFCEAVGTVRIFQEGKRASDDLLGSTHDPFCPSKLVVGKPSLAMLPPTRMPSCYQWRASPQNIKG